MGITELFYGLGGYDSDSEHESYNAYVPELKVTGTYIPFAEKHFNILCAGVHSVSVNSDSTGDPYDDRITAHLALAYADTFYDKLSGNPDAMGSSRHMAEASQLILNAYGVRDRYGRLMFPCHADDYRPYGKGLVADSSF